MAEQKKQAVVPSDRWIPTPVSDSSDYLDSPPLLSLDDLSPEERDAAEAQLAESEAKAIAAGGKSTEEMAPSWSDFEDAPYTGDFFADDPEAA